MIIFLYGEDTYRVREKMKEIIGHYKKIHKSGLNLKYLEKLEDLKDELKQTSIFKEKKLLIINNLFSNQAAAEKFLENIKTDDIILIYQEAGVNKNDSLFKFLREKAKSQEFELLAGQRLKNWIKKEFGKYETTIEPRALEMLAEYVGNDLWLQSNEIKKLAVFRQKKMVEAKDVELLVKPRIETDIFKTIDAIAEKNKKQALKLLHKHLEKGDSPLYLLSMISYQFRNLLSVKDFIEKCRSYNFILQKSGLHPFVVKKSYYQCQKFSFPELKKIFQKIFQIDLDIKTGRIEPETALDMFIVDI